MLHCESFGLSLKVESGILLIYNSKVNDTSERH